jgi:hypothetical protein
VTALAAQELPVGIGSIDVRVETITPDDAERYLARNYNNRNVRPTKVAQWSGAMRRSEWTLNGDAIRFDVFGNLIDGQHRLLACVESGVSFATLVVRGLPSRARNSIDVGAMRSPGDHLKEHGFPDPNGHAAALGYLHRLETGQLRSVGRGYTAPTTDELLALAERYPRITDSVRMSHELNNRLRVPRGQMAALHSWFSTIDSDDADSFFDALTTGLDLRLGDPIYALRSWLEKTKSERRVSRVMIHVVVVKAWNAYRDGEEMKIARYRRVESLPEPK